MQAINKPYESLPTRLDFFVKLKCQSETNVIT